MQWFLWCVWVGMMIGTWASPIVSREDMKQLLQEEIHKIVPIEWHSTTTISFSRVSYIELVIKSKDPRVAVDCLISVFDSSQKTSQLTHLMTTQMNYVRGQLLVEQGFCPPGHTLIAWHDHLSVVLGMKESTIVDASSFRFSQNPNATLSFNFWLPVPIIKSLLKPANQSLEYKDISYYAKSGYHIHSQEYLLDQQEQVEACEAMRHHHVKDSIAQRYANCRHTQKTLVILLDRLHLTRDASMMEITQHLHSRLQVNPTEWDESAVQFLGFFFPVMYFPLGDRMPLCFNIPELIVRRCNKQKLMIKKYT